MNKQILAELAAWWMELPDEELDDPAEAFTNLDILAKAVPELLAEIAELRAIINEFMKQEGRSAEIPAELFVRVRSALGTLPSYGGMAYAPIPCRSLSRP